MGQAAELEVHDQPTKGSWNDDWAAAEQKAAAFEDSEGDSDGKGQSSEQSEEDGTENPDAGSDEGRDPSSEQLPEGEGDAGRQEPDGGSGDESREGREQRVGEKEVASRSERLKAFREEAKALGLEFEGNTVLVAERARFREEKRAAKQKLASQRQAFEDEAAQKVASLEEQLSRASKLEKAVEENDLNRIAELVGHESWNHLSEAALKQQLSPEHRELVELKRERRRLIERQEQDKKAQAEAEETYKRDQARSKYAQKLASQLAANKKYKVFSDDRAFLNSIMAHQEAEWDGEETISIEEAAARAEKDARVLYDRLHLRFGGRAASQSEKQPTSGAQATERPGRSPPKTVSQRQVADASESTDSSELDEKAWLKKYSQMIKTSEYPS